MSASAQPEAVDGGGGVGRELTRFRRRHGLTLADICREIFLQPDSCVQVRNERIAVENLGRIIEATLALSNRKGFAAMSLRELASRSGLSLGGLYAYIKSKNDLVMLIQSQGRRQTERVIRQAMADVDEPPARLTAAIRAHVYLSETLRPWFHFLYMEARLLDQSARQSAVELERLTEQLFAQIIEAGQQSGHFRPLNADLAAGLLKPLLQDWYLKHRKHRERGLDASAYAAEVSALMLRYLR